MANTEVPIKVDVRPAYLGWSNVRAGLEFYRGDGKNNRWDPRDSNYGGEQTYGVLVQDDIERAGGFGEGSVCVVITCGTRDIAFAQKLAAELLDAFARGKEAPRE